jgi:hypothetical protein
LQESGWDSCWTRKEQTMSEVSEVSAVQAAPQTSRLAVTSLLLGSVTFIGLVIIALVLSTALRGTDEFNNLGSVIILVFPLLDLGTLGLSVVAWWRVRKSAGHLKGRGLALGGLLLGLATLALLALIFILLSIHEPTICAPAPPPTPGQPQPPC